MTILLVILAVAALIGFVLYNSLVGKKNQVENAFASIDVYLKKRYDLIPNLVATVKQYAEHEAGTLAKVTEMRARAVSGSAGTDEKVALNNELSAGLGRLMVAVEAYPELKANENFNQLQRTLNEIEEQLSAARRAFNASVTDFNNAVEMFPTNLLAGMMGYTRRTLLVTPEAERANVNVADLFKR
ncbi:MAG: LemA family protein [Verrucomicrobiota bacterium]